MSKLPSGAKEAGLAGGMASLAQGIQGSSLAPSSLAQLKGVEAQASHDQWMQGISQDQMAVGARFGQVGLAVAAEWLDMPIAVLEEAVAMGQVPVLRLGGLVRINRSAVLGLVSAVPEPAVLESP